MRTDHTLKLNGELATAAERVAEAILIREEELSGLRRMHAMLTTAAEHDQPALPSFVSAEDEGFKRVAAAADAVERRNGRPVVTTQIEQAA